MFEPTQVNMGFLLSFCAAETICRLILVDHSIKAVGRDKKLWDLLGHSVVCFSDRDFAIYHHEKY